MSTPLSRRILLAYGLPGFVAAIPIIPISILLPSYYARDLGLGMTLTGVALAIARLFDFLSDLIVGIGIDRVAFRGTRYKPWIVAGALLAGIAMVKLAWPPLALTPWYLGVWSALLFTGWTAMMVPYTAWGAELSSDINERSTITASREIAGVCGMLAALAIPAGLLFFAPHSNWTPLSAISLVAILVGIPALMAALLLVPEPRLGGERITISRAEVFGLLGFTPFRATLLAWLANSFANALPAVLFPLVVTTYFGLDESTMFFLLVAYFGAAILFAPLWLAVARRIGKLNTWMVAIVTNCTFFLPVLLLNNDHSILFGVICLLSGATLGADLALPASIQADVMQRDREEQGKRRTATAFALWSMSTKLALGAAVALGFIGLGLNNADAAEASTTLLLALYVAVPVSVKVLVVVQLHGNREHLNVYSNTFAQPT